MRRLLIVVPVVLALIASGAVSCKKKGPDKGAAGPKVPSVETTGKDAGRGTGGPEESPYGKGPGVSDVAALQTIYFDYDSAELRPEARTTLQKNGNWFKANKAAKIVIEGHCDERGTNEYNQALGERRARAARDYLVAMGVSASQLSTISYGEERPAARGSDESAWSKNRRAEFREVK